jgi:hypothetical protein
VFYTYQGGQLNKLTGGCGAALGFYSSYQLVVFDIGRANSATGVAANITGWIAAARGLLAAAQTTPRTTQANTRPRQRQAQALQTEVQICVLANKLKRGGALPGYATAGKLGIAGQTRLYRACRPAMPVIGLCRA